jgi:hypothetical protein
VYSRLNGSGIVESPILAQDARRNRRLGFILRHELAT